MTNTTYFNLNIVEGTDIVNPLTVDNPNYEKIDEVMHNNAVSGVTLATEISNATVHAINRENSECAVIRFIATSEWKAGDTITVDGVPVRALLPSGETLSDGAYVINANVLCILTGTNLTVYADRKKVDNASDIKYNDTNVADAITSINSKLDAYPNWKHGGSVNGNNVLAIPSVDWKEVIVQFRLHSSEKIQFIYNMRKNDREETHNSVCGYLSQHEITALGLADTTTPHLLWVDFYNHNNNFMMLAANSEDGVENYKMTVWYR